MLDYLPTLADRLRNNQQIVRGPGGTLTEETPETIQSLSGQLGLQAPPLTPLGGAMIGANPHQQKMLGTPQQKQAAFNLASKPDSSLQDTLRRQQVRSQATAQEQQVQQKSQDMQNLGSLGDRVTDFINAQRQALQQQAGQGVEVQAATQFQGPATAAQDISSLKDMLAQYRREPGNQQLLLSLNQALGYDINRQLSPQEVNQLYESAVDSIARGGAGTVDDNLNVDDLVGMQQFGYDKPALSILLGVPEAVLGQMSIGDLRNKINEVAANEFSTTQQLEQQAQSGLLGQAERGMARQAAQEASRTGIRATEADINSLEQQIATADQVQFAGQSYNIEDLLGDETISNIISEYMNSAPDSEIRRQIDQSEPALRDFIQKNQTLLADASQQMQAGASTFQETQDYNKRLQSEPFGGMKLDDNLARAFIPGFGTLQASRIDPNSVPVLRIAMEQGPQYGMKMATNLSSMDVLGDPQTIEDLRGLDYNTMKAWDIGGGDTSAWQTKYIAPKRFWKEVQATPPENRDAFVRHAVTDADNASDIQRRMDDNRALNIMGLSSSLNPGVLDANGDGLMDSGPDIQQRLLKLNPRPSLKEGPSAQKVYTRQEIGQPNIPTDEVDFGLYRKLRGVSLEGGTINQYDLKRANLDINEALRLKELGSRARVDPNDLNTKIYELKDNNTNQVLADVNQAGGTTQERIQKLQAELSRQGPGRLIQPVIENEINKLRQLEADTQQLQSDVASATDSLASRVSKTFGF